MIRCGLIDLLEILYQGPGSSFPARTPTWFGQKVPTNIEIRILYSLLFYTSQSSIPEIPPDVCVLIPAFPFTPNYFLSHEDH